MPFRNPGIPEQHWSSNRERVATVHKDEMQTTSTTMTLLLLPFLTSIDNRTQLCQTSLLRKTTPFKMFSLSDTLVSCEPLCVSCQFYSPSSKWLPQMLCSKVRRIQENLKFREKSETQHLCRFTLFDMSRSASKVKNLIEESLCCLSREALNKLFYQLQNRHQQMRQKSVGLNPQCPPLQ